jgi:antitoxin HicB
MRRGWKMHEQLVTEYLECPYARAIIPDESGRYAAQILEFPGCFSEGATPEEAYENLQEAAKNWLESALSQRMAIPEPFISQGFSGTVSLRLPKSIHRRAVQYAHRDGVSLNQFLVSAIAARVGAEDQATAILSKFDEYLALFQKGAGIWLRIDLATTVMPASPSTAMITLKDVAGSVPMVGGQEMLAAGTASTVDVISGSFRGEPVNWKGY